MINFQRHGASAVCLRERERQLGLGKLVKDAGVAGIPGSLTGCARVHIIIDKAGSLPRACLALAVLHGTANTFIWKPTDHVSQNHLLPLHGKAQVRSVVQLEGFLCHLSAHLLAGMLASALLCACFTLGAPSSPCQSRSQRAGSSLR